MSKHKLWHFNTRFYVYNFTAPLALAHHCADKKKMANVALWLMPEAPA
jgi:hypothetical protein